MSRQFYRCTGCLEVVALAERLAMEYSTTVATCENCAQPFEYMGQAKADRLIQEHLRCKCDDRCTSARGPHCDCKCGGKNHGAGMVGGYMIVQTDHGPIPRVSLPNASRARIALQQFTRYTGLRDVARAEMDQLLERKRGGYLPGDEYSRLRRLQFALGKSYKAKTHASRLKTLSELVSVPDDQPAILPEVLAVENPTPTFEAPFSLTPETRRINAKQAELF